MLDRRSRITVIGGHKRVDVALPSESPIGEYVAGLAGLCGRTGDSAIPPAWSLAAAGEEPWSVDLSLADAGVADGAVLYLRDSAHDPGMAPVIEDVEDLVAEDAKKHRANPGHRGVLAVWLGAAWITLAAVVAALTTHRGGLVAAAGLVLVAIVMLALGWSLSQKDSRLPRSACLAIALCAVPCMAAVGGLVGDSLGGQLFWCGVVVGANVGLLMALAVTPEPAVLAVEIPLAVAGVLAVVLAALGAGGTQAAAAAVVAALATVVVARPLAGVVVAWSARMPRQAAGMAPATTRLMLRARHLLVLILVPPAVALALALPVLALSGNGWALGLVVAAGLALISRARQVGFTSEVVPLGAAGGVGLFSAVSASAYRYLGIEPAVWVVLLAGGLVVGVGAAVAVLYKPRPAEEEPAPFGSVLGTRDRGRFVEVIGVICMVITVALALGVFGVYEELFMMGRGIIG